MDKKPKMNYPDTEWSGYLTQDDMDCVQVDFDKWWKEASKSLPHMAERARVLQLAISKPEHIGYLANFVADAYREVIDAD